MEPEEQIQLIKKNTVEIIQESELLRRITSKGSLCIKLGVDPTTSDIHLGHSIVLFKLRCFQDLGHKIILLIGDFTARVGDPSGRSKTRKSLSIKEIAANARTYREQAFKILAPKKTEVLFNSEWLAKMNFSDVLKLASYYTVARMLERDDFSLRYQKKYPIGLHEFMYPLMQAYDSVAMHADVELGGTDQKFNLLLGRQIQKAYGQPSQIVITMPLLEGIDGSKKMSKSLGNYIGVTEPPYEMYGKVMSIPDELIFKYFRLLTSLSEEEVDSREKESKEGRLHPGKAKEELAERIVSFYHSKSSAEAAKERFEAVFKRKETPADIPSYFLASDEMKEGKIWIVRILQLTGLANSGSEARRLIKQGGVKWDEKIVKDIGWEVSPGESHVLQAGKRKFIRIVRKHY